MAMKFAETADADFGVTLWGGIFAGAPTAATDFVNGFHLRSTKFQTATASSVQVPTGSIADAGWRFSYWIYINAQANATASILNVTDVTGANSIVRIRITTAGVLQLWSDTVQIGSNGGTIATGGWHRLTFVATITSTTVNHFKVFLDGGAASIDLTNGTLGFTGSSFLFIGNNSGNTTLDIRTSDHYLDDVSTLLDTGNVWTTAKRPFANGTTNGFTTQIGAGGSSYGSGHAPQVNERALSQTNGWSMVGAGSAVTEEYSVEGAGVGDTDISRAFLIDYMGWLFAKALVGETASIVVGGTSSANVGLTSTASVFTQVKGSGIYPAGGTDIGLVTTTALTTVSLYECGLVMAYIPTVFSPNKFWKQAVNRAGTY